MTRESRRDNDSSKNFRSVSSRSQSGGRSSGRNSSHHRTSLVKHRKNFFKLKVPILTGDYELEKFDFHGWRDRAETYLKRVDATYS